MMTKPIVGIRLGEVARSLGFCTRTLLRAESAGRIPRARRDSAGHRRYTADEIEVIRAVLSGDVQAYDGGVAMDTAGTPSEAHSVLAS